MNRHDSGGGFHFSLKHMDSLRQQRVPSADAQRLAAWRADRHCKVVANSNDDSAEAYVAHIVAGGVLRQQRGSLITLRNGACVRLPPVVCHPESVVAIRAHDVQKRTTEAIARQHEANVDASVAYYDRRLRSEVLQLQREANAARALMSSRQRGSPRAAPPPQVDSVGDDVRCDDDDDEASCQQAMIAPNPASTGSMFGGREGANSFSRRTPTMTNRREASRLAAILNPPDPYGGRPPFAVVPVRRHTSPKRPPSPTPRHLSRALEVATRSIEDEVAVHCSVPPTQNRLAAVHPAHVPSIRTIAAVDALCRRKQRPNHRVAAMKLHGGRAFSYWDTVAALAALQQDRRPGDVRSASCPLV